ncbi:MAG: TolC family protein [Planctomycetota bacterium]
MAIHIGRASLALLLGGCVLAPAGLDEERAALDESGRAFAAPFAAREVPPLAERPGWRELLARAFAANGELEAAYFEWRAALERVSIAAGWPDTNVMPSFSTMFSDESMKAWDRTTVMLGFDPMSNLSLPVKVRKAGEVALAEARAAGSRFAAGKFALQRAVLDGWLELALREEEVRIQAERLALARAAFESAAERAAVAGEHRDLLRMQVEAREAEIELEAFETQARAARAMLNGMLARAAGDPLEIEPALPPPRPLPADDAVLLAAGVANNPELRALAFAVDAGAEALELARLQVLPDFNPFASLTGSLERMIGVGVSLPTRLPQIRAGIAAARAMLRETQAMRRQTELDRSASFAAALVVLRFSERQADFLAREIQPVAEQALGSAHKAYATGEASFLELLAAQEVLLDVRLAVAEARIERERRLAEIEELAGLDVETLAPGGGQPIAFATTAEVDRHE